MHPDETAQVSGPRRRPGGPSAVGHPRVHSLESQATKGRVQRGHTVGEPCCPRQLTVGRVPLPTPLPVSPLRDGRRRGIQALP